MTALAPQPVTDPRDVAMAKKRAQIRKGETMTAPPVLSAVDRAQLSAILKNDEEERAHDDLLRIPVDEAPVDIATLDTAALKAILKPGRDLEATEENAAMCAQARAALPWGRVELWAVRHSKSAKPEYLWATPSAITATYPDRYTRERRRMAGVLADAKAGRPELIERFGVFKAPAHG